MVDKICPILNDGCIDYGCLWFGNGCPAYPDNDHCGEIGMIANNLMARRKEVELLEGKIHNRAYNALARSYHSSNYRHNTWNLPADKSLFDLSEEEMGKARGIGRKVSEEILKAIASLKVSAED